MSQVIEPSILALPHGFGFSGIRNRIIGREARIWIFGPLHLDYSDYRTLGFGLSGLSDPWIWIIRIIGLLDLDYLDYRTLGFGLSGLSDPWIGIANPCQGL